ncbi:MAG: flippase [Bulleidia sp.]|nr:flippase [Bulleidia sp.]
MDRKLISNYIYNILYNILSVILPFITTPYLYRTLGTDTLGIYNYAASIMQWFILFGVLGVNTYGNREIAKVKNNKDDLNRTFFEIFWMQMLNVAIAMAAYLLFAHFAFGSDAFYYELTGLTMVATMMDITWFFYGIEDFRTASIRNMAVRIIGVAAILIFIKSKDDLGLYIVINIVTQLIGQLIMFLQLRQYIHFQKVSLKDAYQHHFKATFQLFIPTIAISVYTMFDKTMIGALYNKSHVTLYTTAMDLDRTMTMFITSIGAVMLPRVTNIFYNDENGEEKAKNMVNTTMKIALMLGLPMCFGMIGIAHNFVAWYLPETPEVGELIAMGAPIIILIAMSNVTGTQYMVPTGMYNQYTASVVLGCCVNVFFNFMLIPKYGAYGAIIGSVIAEAAVTTTQMILIHKKMTISFLQKSYLCYAAGTALMYFAVWFVGRITPISFVGSVLQILAGVLVYFLVLYFSREDFCMKVLEKARHRGKKNA